MTQFLFSISIIFAIAISSVKTNFDHDNSKRPHIIIILADDLGWNDVSFHGANQIPTPNIDALAYNGIILNNHYVQALCTPSRASLMTGKYPTSLGMQHSVLLEPEPRGLPLKEKLLPQYFREAGYKTYAIGKWHLGYYKREYTPTYRGFDTFFGYWNGQKDYYSHLCESTFEKWIGLDIRKNLSIAWDAIGHYATDLFTKEAVRLINNHNQDDPMLLYLAHQAAHAGNMYKPFQAPEEEIGKFPYIDDPERRIYAAMVTKLDESVGEVINALRKKRMLENSIILFSSDNGAPTIGIHNNRGSNYPLRGIKESPFEGAIRGAAAIWSPVIKNPRRVSYQLMSIVDWLPTLYSAAGLNPQNLGNIDGIDMWRTLMEGTESPRSEILVTINDIDNYVSIREGNYKYIRGQVSHNVYWYGESGRSPIYPIYDPYNVIMSKTGKTFTTLITKQQIADINWRRNHCMNSNETNIGILTPRKILELRSQAEIHCNVAEEDMVFCNPREKPCLYNIQQDPCEMIDISALEPEMVQHLEDIIMKFRLTIVPPGNIPADSNANPINWNNTWVNWGSECPLCNVDDFSRYDGIPLNPHSHRFFVLNPYQQQSLNSPLLSHFAYV